MKVVRMSILAVISSFLTLFSGAVMLVLAWPLTTAWQAIPISYFIAVGLTPFVVNARVHGGRRIEVVRRTMWCWSALSVAILPFALAAFAV